MQGCSKNPVQEFEFGKTREREGVIAVEKTNQQNDRRPVIIYCWPCGHCHVLGTLWCSQDVHRLREREQSEKLRMSFDFSDDHAGEF